MQKPADRLNRLSRTLFFDEPVSNVKGISSARSAVLSKMKIKSVRDLLTHFPRRYIDLSKVCSISDAEIGQKCTISGTIFDIVHKRTRKKLDILEITLTDNTSTMIVTVFNQPWLANKINKGDVIAVAGKVEFNYGFKRMTNPFMETVLEGSVKGKVLSIHPATEKISANVMRNLIKEALFSVSGVFDPIPYNLRIKRSLMGRFESLVDIHFPQKMEDIDRARERLVYEEVLMLELFLMSRDSTDKADLVPRIHDVSGPVMERFSKSIPFALTDDQVAAKDDMLKLMSSPHVMNHLILGDVGTGKTVVSCFGMAAAVDSGGQTMFLAPTEVLARQHFGSVSAFFEGFDIKISLLCGSVSASERRDILDRFSSGKIDILIGTHALLEDDVVPENLSFVIIDEQQRFGVNQRAKILAKGDSVDALFLTATPIPRSLALAIFGNLTLSYIRQKPNSDTLRNTYVYPKQSQGKAFDFAKDALKRGEQVYVVCPLVGLDSKARDKASNKSDDDIDSETYHPYVSIEQDDDFVSDNPTAAKEEAIFLQNKVFPDYRVELLYGSMSAEDKDSVMNDFKEGRIDVLVSTTVIEVGVDVENASVMIIEDADRFGLSQLHQLRGRVGRGSKEGHVFLVSSSKQEAALMRLGALEKSDDGFALAEYDLSLRREGDILGNRQSGTSTLKLVNIIRDGKIIEAAHEDASEIIARDPHLEQPGNLALKRELGVLFAGETEVSGG